VERECVGGGCGWPCGVIDSVGSRAAGMAVGFEGDWNVLFMIGRLMAYWRCVYQLDSSSACVEWRLFLSINTGINVKYASYGDLDPCAEQVFIYRVQILRR